MTPPKTNEHEVIPFRASSLPDVAHANVNWLVMSGLLVDCSGESGLPQVAVDLHPMIEVQYTAPISSSSLHIHRWRFLLFHRLAESSPYRGTRSGCSYTTTGFHRGLRRRQRRLNTLQRRHAKLLLPPLHNGPMPTSTTARRRRGN